MQAFTFDQLVAEIARVRDIVNNPNTKHKTKVQQKRYLRRLLNDYYAYKHYKGV